MRQWALNIEYWMITERRQTRHVMDHVITGMEMVLGSLLSPPSLRKLRDFFQVIVTMNMFIELNDISPLAVAVPSFCLDIWKTADTFGVKLPLAVVIYAVRAVVFATWILALSRPSTLGYDLWSDLSFPLCVENARCRSFSCPNLDLSPLVD